MSFTPLQFLVFDESDDPDGWRTWEALASPAAQHNAALLDEVQNLTQAITTILGPPGPVDEGHAWDMDLMVTQQAAPASPSDVQSESRITLALSLVGGDALAQMLSEHRSAQRY